MTKKIFLLIIPVVLIVVLVFIIQRKKHIPDAVINSTETQEVVVADAPLDEETTFVYSVWDELTNHPLDKELLQCATKDNPGTSGETVCLTDATGAWEGDLVDTIELLIGSGVLDEASMQQFETSQKQWEVYKDAEFNFIQKKYENSDGTMYPNIIAREQMMMVRHRALEVYGYYQTLIAERG